MKDVGLRIRVQKELRGQFLEACRKQDKPAAQVLREFMRRYVAEQGAVQTDKKSKEKQKAENSLTRKTHRKRNPSND